MRVIGGVCYAQRSIDLAAICDSAMSENVRGGGHSFLTRR